MLIRGFRSSISSKRGADHIQADVLRGMVEAREMLQSVLGSSNLYSNVERVFQLVSNSFTH